MADLKDRRTRAGRGTSKRAVRAGATAGLAALSACGPGKIPGTVHGKHVDFSLSDDAAPHGSAAYIHPRFTVTPYTQWNENNGYCGELSSIQAGMGNGQWMSQFNARQICGSTQSQSGPDGFCAANGGTANYNAQVLYESVAPGDQPFASSPVCLANAHLAFETFDYAHQAAGMAGYQQFMAWVKARVIAGDTVSVGVLNRGGDDPQYDHEVTVSQIGTNHAPTDAGYYDDDVLYFEDHGDGGAAFDRGYTFASLAQSRASANALGANVYSILIPGGDPVYSGSGGDGIHPNPRAITPSDYAFAVAGALDPQHVLLPVTVGLAGSSVGGVANPERDAVGYNYETPEIGQELGTDCTNVPPTWMDVTLSVVVSGLTPGVSYNLYEYDLSGLSGTAGAAALKLPDSDFNAKAAQATKRTTFVATAATYTQQIATTSDNVVVLRAVRADAP